MGARERGMGEATAGRRARPGPRRRLRDEAGAVAVIVALTFSAIFLAVAVAIDFARPQTEVVRVENAAAAAALAASHRLGLPDQDTTHWQDRDAPFELTSSTPHQVGIPMQSEQGQPRATAKANILTSLLKAVGGKSIGVGGSTSVKKGRARSRLPSCSITPDRWRANPSPISAWRPRT
jgi:hypothetical protein